jgi:outer membrane protein TolC
MNFSHRLRRKGKGGLGKLALLLLLGSGCAVGPNFVPPEPPPVATYTHSPLPTATLPADGQAQRYEPGAEVVAEWWRLFRSPEIGAVVGQAITNNLTLQAAQASLRQAKGLYGGVALSGAVVAVREGWNNAYYGRQATPIDILIKRKVVNPQAAGLVNAVEKIAGK